MRNYLRIILIVISTIYLTSCVSNIGSISKDKIRKLEDGMGYLFIVVDIDFNYSRFSIDGAQEVYLNSPDFYNGKNYYLLPVRSGDYQIKYLGNLQGGRYNFSNFGNSSFWSFFVAPNKISYVGELNVRKSNNGFSQFNLVNNSSFALEYLENKYPNILANKILEFHGPGKDFFFKLVQTGDKNSAKDTNSVRGKYND